MRLLLDTHALLWWLAGDDRSLSRRARDAIQNADNEIFVSAASAWEIATKQRLGRLDAAVLSQGFTQILARQRFATVDITLDHAERAGALPNVRDPFDRMLIAQAQACSMTLVSNDALFDHHGISRLW